MPLYQLSEPVGNLAGPNTGILPGGAGVQTAGTSFNPGISAPRLEENQIEVLDVSAPTLLSGANTVNASKDLGIPTPSGKVMFLSPTGIGGSRWKLDNTGSQQRFPLGTVGVVTTPAEPQSATNPSMGYAVSTAFGNECTGGYKAVVQYRGPCQAFVETTVGGSAISAGMFLTPDGAGNLTYAGASPNAGTVVAIALGAVGSSISTPVLIPVNMASF